jgi:hypothetical protein
MDLKTPTPQKYHGLAFKFKIREFFGFCFETSALVFTYVAILITKAFKPKTFVSMVLD